MSSACDANVAYRHLSCASIPARAYCGESVINAKLSGRRVRVDLRPETANEQAFAKGGFAEHVRGRLNGIREMPDLASRRDRQRRHSQRGVLRLLRPGRQDADSNRPAKRARSISPPIRRLVPSLYCPARYIRHGSNVFFSCAAVQSEANRMTLSITGVRLELGGFLERTSSRTQGVSARINLCGQQANMSVQLGSGV
jgi:hypothetical protein